MLDETGTLGTEPTRALSEEEWMAFEEQIALERKALVELLLDFYESKCSQKARVVDDERESPTMKERS